MERIITGKKAIRFVVCICLAVLFAGVLSVSAYAESGDITYHFKMPAGWSAGTTAYHSWSSLDLEGGPTIEIWGAYKATLIDEGDGWAKITVKNGINETGFSFVNWNTVTASAINELKLFNADIKYANVSDAFCKITSTEGDGEATWYKDKDMTQLIPVEEYYIAGSEAIAGYNWYDGFEDRNYGLKMTAANTEGIHTATIKKVPAGSYEFKIYKDPKNYGKNLVIEASSGNFGFTTTEIKDITINYNWNEVGDDRVEIIAEDTVIFAADVIAEINKIGEVTLESKTKIESAEEFYALASVDEQEKVTNYAELLAAREKYNKLIEEQKYLGGTVREVSMPETEENPNTGAEKPVEIIFALSFLIAAAAFSYNKKKK